ncbi:outer membrane protein assembly factor BamB family protein [Crateriforma conspicua]|uniref:outer membrane protein assembly factor BamB family protein n=1 Tax=Crateriforma conspicua TaxID=2527996 RepID=UPI00118A1187|nr:PQQ-binding-like beta-propeller repeat protein [Crateriforma conspicua]QDV63696.1 Outer membrane protein assembly factor BamB precursor [Crateriforma conspicua]
MICIRTRPSADRPVRPRPANFRVAALAASMLVLAILPGSASGADDGWTTARGDVQGTGTVAQTLPADLTVVWEHETGEAIESTPVVADGRVFVADVMGKLTAIDLLSGKPLWTHDYETGFNASPTLSGDRLVIGDIDGNVYALNVADGSEIWTAQTDGTIDGCATFFEDDVLVTSQDGSLYRLGGKTGEQIWVYETGDQIRCSPTLAGTRTFLGGCDGNLHVVDVRSGKAVGDLLPLGGPTGSTVSVRDQQAVVATMEGMIFAFDWRDGTMIWEYTDPDRAQEYRNSAAMTDDLVIVSSKNKKVDAIDRETGQHRWRYSLRRHSDASPVVAGNDVWIAATDGRLVRLDLTTGKEKSVTEFRGGLYGSPAILSDSMIIADDDGVVRRLGPAAQK